MKKIIAACFLVALSLSSYSQENNEIMKEKTIKMVKEYYQNLDLNKGDISKMKNVFNKEMLFYFVGTSTGFSVKDFIEPSKAYYAAFPDLKHNVIDVL